nr:EscU/YscU/HrcU family type III secretion system export apparatus switch protein [Angustibacter aerolatus]
MSGEKTEKPTPKRLKQARSEGNVARTPDVGAWVTILAATVLVPKVGRDVADVARAMLVRAIDAIQHPTPEVALQAARQGPARLDGGAAAAGRRDPGGRRRRDGRAGRPAPRHEEGSSRASRASTCCRASSGCSA